MQQRNKIYKKKKKKNINNLLTKEKHVYFCNYIINTYNVY